MRNNYKVNNKNIQETLEIVKHWDNQNDWQIYEKGKQISKLNWLEFKAALPL
jgi:hypothetical protein